mgnify:CR=1 FL=1
MKKFILLLTAVALSTGAAFAQEQTPEERLNSALDLAKSGNEAFEADSPELALEAFQQSLQLALGVGEIGAAHVETCKTAICNIYMKLAKNAYNAHEWDNALTAFEKVKEVATEYGNADIAAEAEKLLVNTKANQISALAAEAKKNKDYATAAGYYQQMVEMDPSNGGYSLQLGDVLYRAKDWDNAVVALENAAANGDFTQAKEKLLKYYKDKFADIDYLEDILWKELGTKEDYLEATKIIYKFSKDNDYYKIKGGVIDGKVMSTEEIVTLAKLPSRQDLLSMLAGGLLANISKLAVALEQVRLQKEEAE